MSVDNRKPVSMDMFHLRRNLKKEQAEYDRADEINKHNHILLERMTSIHQNVSDDTAPRTVVASRAHIDRNNALHRVQEENVAILTRITLAKPNYARSKQAKDWKKATKLMRAMQHYPKPILRPLRHPAPFQVSIPRERDEMQEMMHDFMAERANALPPMEQYASEYASEGLLADGLAGARPHPPLGSSMRRQHPPQRHRQLR
jgi:hypothetical protein